MSMRKIFRMAAKKHGVTVKEFKSEMQLAVDEGWRNKEKGACVMKMQNAISANVPSPEEIISFALQNMLANAGEIPDIDKIKKDEKR